MLGRARILAKLLAALLALAVLVSMSGLAVFERREALDNAQQRNELIARTLEDHVTRTVESAVADPADAGRRASPSRPPRSPARLQPLLGQGLLTGLPFLRSAAVLDEQGSVLASSIPAEQGLQRRAGAAGPAAVAMAASCCCRWCTGAAWPTWPAPHRRCAPRAWACCRCCAPCEGLAAVDCCWWP